MLTWFESYLCGRQMRVKCETASSNKTVYSDYKVINYGTPQGSCLGPLIFLIFTNDLYRHLHHCRSILFADDTTLYKSHRNLRYLKWCLEDEMQNITKWFAANKLTLNLDKTVCILFQRNNKTEKIELNVNGVRINSQPFTKFLGMWLDQHLTWFKHIEMLTLKLIRNQNLLKLSSNHLCANTKKMIYHFHLGSHIQYGIILWGNGATNTQINKIQKIQTKSIKYITNKKPTAQTNKELGILTIVQQIELANYKFGYKLVNNLLPSRTQSICLEDSKKNSLTKQHNYGTRNKYVPNLPAKASTKYLNSFLCKGPRSITNLPHEVRIKPNLTCFVRACKKFLLSQL